MPSGLVYAQTSASTWLPQLVESRLDDSDSRQGGCRVCWRYMEGMAVGKMKPPLLPLIYMGGPMIERSVTRDVERCLWRS